MLKKILIMSFITILLLFSSVVFKVYAQECHACDESDECVHAESGKSGQSACMERHVGGRDFCYISGDDCVGEI